MFNVYVVKQEGEKPKRKQHLSGYLLWEWGPIQMPYVGRQARGFILRTPNIRCRRLCIEWPARNLLACMLYFAIFRETKETHPLIPKTPFLVWCLTADLLAQLLWRTLDRWGLFHGGSHSRGSTLALWEAYHRSIVHNMSLVRSVSPTAQAVT